MLTSYDGNTITYDTIGNPLTDGTWTYTWQNGRELASMTDGATTWTYTYDANGLRKTRSNGTDTYTYVYNGSQLVQMTRGTDVLYFDHATGTVTWTDTTTDTRTVYYYVHNLQGDVVAILNSAGTAVVNYTYDAWGNLLATTGSMASTLGTLNPLTYRGYVYDRETGLYYLQSRYYNPEVGRFINSDGVLASVSGSVQGYNVFAYCFNNPVNMTDNAGTWPSWNDIKSGFNTALDWANSNLLQPILGFIYDVAEDYNNYDLNNQSETVVFSSNYFSGYRGAFVMKTPFDASFSFGFIGLSIHQQDSSTIKHEYGHTVQFKEK